MSGIKKKSKLGSLPDPIHQPQTIAGAFPRRCLSLSPSLSSHSHINVGWGWTCTRTWTFLSSVKHPGSAIPARQRAMDSMVRLVVCWLRQGRVQQ